MNRKQKTTITAIFDKPTRANQHRPHPGKEAKRYQVEGARRILELLGVGRDE
ncbi:MAG: hypothetical protein H0V76_08420 [Blastocatellia bacterium]|nr:hypothetical protein [Blastocatellia bacterium]